MSDSLPNLNKLEKMLFNNPSLEFPQLPSSYAENTQSFPERYTNLKKRLGNMHDQVEAGALLNSISENVPYDSLVYLNQHGKGHVEAVMNHVAELLSCIENNLSLSGFELFLLLCSIQIHDIGNINGRDDHTTSFQNDFYKIAPECFITEPGLKELIFQIARVHGGAIAGDKDTIAKVLPKTMLLNCPVRVQLLASLLRFGDELADDFTRAKDIEQMPEASKLFHAYSKSLNSVKLEKNKNEHTCFVQLCYYLTKEEAERRYKKNNSEISLLEEILNRTEKMERERRYCSHFLVPHILLTMIKIEINVFFQGEFSARPYEYTLRESGYPNGDVEITNRDEILREVTGEGATE